MKKIFLIISLITAVFVVTGGIGLQASGSWQGNMKEDVNYYYNFHTGSSNYVYGELTNREDLYDDTNYTGYGKVWVDENNAGHWGEICGAEDSKMSAKDAVSCDDSWHNSYEDFRTKGQWEVVNGSSNYIYGQLE